MREPVTTTSVSSVPLSAVCASTDVDVPNDISATSGMADALIQAVSRRAFWIRAHAPSKTNDALCRTIFKLIGNIFARLPKKTPGYCLPCGGAFQRNRFYI